MEKILRVIIFLFIINFVSFNAKISSCSEEILKKRCSSCHDYSRVYEVKKRTYDDWKKLIDRMIGYGAILSESERLSLINYLNKLKNN